MAAPGTLNGRKPPLALLALPALALAGLLAAEAEHLTVNERRAEPLPPAGAAASGAVAEPPAVGAGVTAAALALAARTTAAKALHVVVEAGLAEVSPGVGTYVTKQ